MTKIDCLSHRPTPVKVGNQKRRNNQDLRKDSYWISISFEITNVGYWYRIVSTE
jgi:hypothetical protein